MQFTQSNGTFTRPNGIFTHWNFNGLGNARSFAPVKNTTIFHNFLGREMKTLFVVLLALVAFSANVFAGESYIKIEGIDGEVLYKGDIALTGTVTLPEGSVAKKFIVVNNGVEQVTVLAVEVIDFNSSRSNREKGNLTSARDAGSGLATGKRQHKPFVFTKELDKSSPLLVKSVALTYQKIEFNYVNNRFYWDIKKEMK